MAAQPSRRTLLKGGIGAGIAILTAACGTRQQQATPPAAAPSLRIGPALLDTVTRVTAVAFGTTALGTGSQNGPQLVDQAIREATRISGGTPVPVGWVPGRVPQDRLCCIASALGDAREGGRRATTIQGVAGRGIREVPAVVQLALSVLVLDLAGVRTDHLNATARSVTKNLSWLRQHNTVDDCMLVDGSPDPHARGLFRATTITGERTVEVEWDPSLDDENLPSRLQVRKGRVAKNVDPVWDREVWIPVAAHHILDPTPPVPDSGGP